MATLSDIKVDVANQLGATNGADSVPKRDRAINAARREFYSAYKWSFLKKSDTVTITSQLGSLPATYNEKYDPEEVYTYTGNDKYTYAKVAWDDLDSYTTNSYVYAIDKENGQIKINQTTVSSITLDYYHLPADAAISTADDANTEPAPDITPIVLNAIARWWLTSERSTAKYQLFRDEYKEALAQAKKQDAMNRAVKPINLNPVEQGFNQGWTGYVPKGYVGRHG